MTPKEVLIEAHRIISDPARWTRYVLARDEVGRVTAPCDPTATCFCAVGSLYKAAECDPRIGEGWLEGDEGVVTEAALLLAAELDGGGELSSQIWPTNDIRGEDGRLLILAAMERAIARE